MKQMGFRDWMGVAVRGISGLQRVHESRTRGAAILVYHGVCEQFSQDGLERYFIDVSTLRAHLRFIRQFGDIVSISDILNNDVSGETSRNRRIAITFDDALSNQTSLAAEVMSEVGVPWAICVPAGLVESRRTVWSYELQFLLTKCWDHPTVPKPGHGGGGVPTRDGREKAAAIQSIHRVLCQSVSSEERETYLNDLISIIGSARCEEELSRDGRFMMASWSQLFGVVQNGVEVISHGWLHRPQNQTLTQNHAVEESSRSKAVLETKLGKPVIGYAFPHGICPLKTSRLQDDGYKYALSTQSGWVSSPSERWKLPRFDGEYPLAILRRHLARPR